MSEAAAEVDAVAAAQPLRSPPPAKAVVMFQASLGTSSTEANKWRRCT